MRTSLNESKLESKEIAGDAQSRPTVFTIFAMGTFQDVSTESILSQFHARCDQPDNSLILRGPGALDGTIVKAENKDIIKNNINRACDSIDEFIIRTQNERSMNEPCIVNLAGFSRGAVTCLRIANEMERRSKDKTFSAEERARYASVRFNIFNIDPVSGPSNKGDPEAKTVPENVLNYTATLQMDEQRRAFKPQDMTRTIVENPVTTNVTFLPMYGNHSDTNKIKSNDKKDAAILTWHLLYGFLSNHGTRFQNGRMPELLYSPEVMEHENVSAITTQEDAKKLLANCHEAWKNRKVYEQYGGKIDWADYPAAKAPREFLAQRELYVSDSDFFLNQYERELFKVAYPKAFNFFFEHGLLDENDPENTGINDADIALGELHDYPGMERIDKRISSVNNRGHARIERCDLLKDIHPDLIKEDKKFRETFDEKNLRLLESSIVNDLLQYKRGKNIFLRKSQQRTHMDEAREFLLKTKEIANGKGSPEKKYAAMLEAVKEEFIRVRQSSPWEKPGDYCKTLGKILIQNGYQPVVKANPAATAPEAARQGAAMNQKIAAGVVQVLSVLPRWFKEIGKAGLGLCSKLYQNFIEKKSLGGKIVAGLVGLVLIPCIAVIFAPLFLAGWLISTPLDAIQTAFDKNARKLTTQSNVWVIDIVKNSEAVQNKASARSRSLSTTAAVALTVTEIFPVRAGHSFEAYKTQAGAVRRLFDDGIAAEVVAKQNQDQADKATRSMKP